VACARGTQVVGLPDIRPSVVTAAINRNSLFFFLLCNLCTGAVNLSMQTIYQDDCVAVVVMVVYMTFTATVAVVLHHRQVRLKWW